VAKQFGIDVTTVDLTETKASIVEQIQKSAELTDMAIANIAPRLRMATVYAVALSRNSLVAGTGNRSEGYMGYFTKWGDGAFDINPIADLTVTEIYEFLEYLGAPESIITKAPSAGLFEGQTDESEMGITYKKIDEYLLENKGTKEDIELIEAAHAKSEHKRCMPSTYGG
jgi:NAD+ synthase